MNFLPKKKYFLGKKKNFLGRENKFLGKKNNFLGRKVETPRVKLWIPCYEKGVSLPGESHCAWEGVSGAEGCGAIDLSEEGRIYKIKKTATFVKTIAVS